MILFDVGPCTFIFVNGERLSSATVTKFVRRLDVRLYGIGGCDGVDQIEGRQDYGVAVAFDSAVGGGYLRMLY
jgi:hypothetical protein